MYKQPKQPTSKNHRSKGIKVKHVLQICLLVGVCFWLIYQVKHSREKRRAFDAKDEKIVDKVQSDGDVLRFGRKDLPRSAEIATGGEKQGEDEEEKETEEEENRSEEEGVKHKEDEPERDNVQTGDSEVEAGDGGDEIDEKETEKSDSDHVNEEELVDVDRDKEENENVVEENLAGNEEKEDPGKEEQSEGEDYEVAKIDKSEIENSEDVDKEEPNEIDVASDEQDHDGDAKDAHEAREELYKADDASSEVAHNVQSIMPETENVTMGHANKMFGKASSGLDNGTEISSKNTLIKEVRMTGKIGDEISNVTIPERKMYEANLTNLDDGSPDNTTSVHSHQLATSSNSTSLDENLSKNSTVQGTKGNTDQSKLVNILEKNNRAKLAAVGNEQFESTTNLNRTESIDQNATESLSSNKSTVVAIQKTNDTNVSETVKDSSGGNGLAVQKSENSRAAGSDETSTWESYDEGSGGVQHDPIDVSDTRITEEEKEARTDSDMLPEVKTKVDNSEEDVAE